MALPQQAGLQHCINTFKEQTSLIYTAVAHIKGHLQASSSRQTPSWHTNRIQMHKPYNVFMSKKCLIFLLGKEKTSLALWKRYKNYAKVKANKEFSMISAILQCKIHPVIKHSIWIWGISEIKWTLLSPGFSNAIYSLHHA